MNQVQTIFSRLSAILGPMLLGISLAVGCNKFLKKKQKKNTDQDYHKSKKLIATVSDYLSISLLLPSFLFESMLNMKSWTDILLAFFVGFFIPLLCYYLVKRYVKYTDNKEYAPSKYKSFPFLVSTFGGGNRGNIFIIALFSTSSHFNDYIKYFSALDLGNLFFLLLIVPFLLKSEYASKPLKQTSFLSFLKEPIVIGLLVVLGLFISREVVRTFWEFDISSILSHYATERKLVFTVFIFFAITLRVDFAKGNLNNFFYDLLAFYSVRIVSMVIIVLLLLFIFPTSYSTKLVIFSAIILLLMPPSSILPGMLPTPSTTAEVIDATYANTTFAAFNIVYFLYLAVGIIINLSQELI